MDKWYFIGLASFLVIIGITFGYSEYLKYQCRVEAMNTGRSAEEINKICH